MVYYLRFIIIFRRKWIFKMTAKKSGAGMLIFMGWLIYTFSYLGKLDYSANITQIIDYYGITKSEAGLVPSFFFFAYGIGQVVNGLMCKKYNIRWMVFTSLIASSLINFFIALGCDFQYVKWLWMLNGFALSILWPTIIRLMSESLPKKDLARSSVIMGTTVAAGTLIIYGCSSIFAIFNGFKYAFYLAAFADLAISIFWILFYKKAVNMALAGKETPKTEDEKVETGAQKSSSKSIFCVIIPVLCFCAVGVNLIKDGLTTWVPSILKNEYSLNDSLSILLTLLLPMVAIFGNALAVKMHKKFIDYITHCALVFVIMAAIILMIIGSLSIKNVFIMLFGLITVNLLASSLNSLVTSVFPMFMREKINSGMFAGVLNGFCYLGSTLSSYGLGVIAEHFGWTSVFWLLLGFCVVVAIIWVGYKIYKMSVKETDTKIFS